MVRTRVRHPYLRFSKEVVPWPLTNTSWGTSVEDLQGARYILFQAKQHALRLSGLTGCMRFPFPTCTNVLHWRAYLYAARLDIRCRGLVLTSSKRNLRPPNVLP